MVPTGSVVRKRIALLLVVFLGLFCLLAWQLFRLQVLGACALQQKAQRQWTRESVIEPKRGTLYDRKKNALAVSATAYAASVSPRQVRDAHALAQVLSPILNMEAEAIEKKASDRAKGGVTLKRQLGEATARQLRQMIAENKETGAGILDGLYLEEDAKRYYPMGSFASQLIGLTTVDGVGQSGLEKSFNKYLSGKAGRILSEIDGKGRQLSSGANEYVASVDGSSVTLTIDSAIQSIVEQAAREAMTVNGAKAVRVLVMDPATGEILAMCAKPDFDLNDPPREDVAALNELMRNRIIVDAYEPGSTFKIITTASALEAGVTSVGEGFYCSGSVMVEGGRIKCWGNPHGAETMARALENSCNPVFVELGLRLGVERFYDYLEAFGLGKPTGVDLSGEAGGILIDRAACKRVDIARIGFGQSVAVTPIQMLSAACAAVNGGNLMRPYVVQEIISPSGEIVERTKPQVLSHPISEKTSGVMRKLLEGVVKNGGGKNAYLKRYRVGGKTGTAQLYVDGLVSSETHIGSFLGFAPIDEPKIGVLVVVDEAAIRPDFGSVTSAPFARQIIERTLVHLGVAPTDEQAVEAKKTCVPGVVGMDTGEALGTLKAAGFTGLLDGPGRKVIDQLPAAGVMMAAESQIMLYVEGTPSAEGNRVSVPDVRGLTISEANRLVKSYGLTMKISGTGIAVDQTPAAGEMVTPTGTVRVAFEKPGG
ncbi:MAG: penicillin-binding transpeptidase domain-containing protein [Clostridia bacterium]